MKKFKFESEVHNRTPFHVLVDGFHLLVYEFGCFHVLDSGIFHELVITINDAEIVVKVFMSGKWVSHHLQNDFFCDSFDVWIVLEEHFSQERFSR